MESKKIGIIGINGCYGKWLERFFMEQQCLTMGSDVDTVVTNRQVVEQSDVVIFAVPITLVVNVIDEVVPFSRRGQLWMDVTSLKEPAVAAMLDSEASVVGLHPICAPTVTSLRGQTMVVCPARIGQDWASWFESFLQATQATIKLSNPREHDKYMAVVQGLPHAINLIMASVIRGLNINVAESMEYTSPFYRIAFSLMGRILSQKSALYADIQMGNPHLLPILSVLEKNANLFERMVAEHDKTLFRQHFDASREHFGARQTKEASQFFDDLIMLKADLSAANMIEVMVHRDRPGLLVEIAKILDEAGVSLTSFHSQKLAEGKFRFLVGLNKLKELPEIQTALGRVRQIPDVEISR